MILELDCGNSLLKWRLSTPGDVATAGSGAAETLEALLATVAAQAGQRIGWARMVSVRTDAETQHIRKGIADALGVDVALAQPARMLAGVSNGYSDFARLGMDRWLAVVAAYRMAAGPSLVLDLGTAITADLVNGMGQHLGGYICPGLGLMRSQLTSNTRRVRYEQVPDAQDPGVPGRVTEDAVERGCMLMLRGFVHEQVELAKSLLEEPCSFYLTGGDAHLVADLLPGAHHVPDLVFRGLALACPGKEEV